MAKVLLLLLLPFAPRQVTCSGQLSGGNEVGGWWLATYPSPTCSNLPQYLRRLLFDHSCLCFFSVYVPYTQRWILVARIIVWCNRRHSGQYSSMNSPAPCGSTNHCPHGQSVYITRMSDDMHHLRLFMISRTICKYPQGLGTILKEQSSESEQEILRNNTHIERSGYCMICTLALFRISGAICSPPWG